MTYAGERVIFDADSHLMELPDFLARNAERAVLQRMPSLGEIRLSDVGERMRSFEGANGHDPQTVAARVALGDRITRGPKWHDALGAFNGKERGLALDLLGFQRQVVFSSFCATKVFEASDIDVRYAAAAAHNRSMAEFCDADERLLGVALAPLDEPQRALALIGCRLGAQAGRDLDPVAGTRRPFARSPGTRRDLASTGRSPRAVHPPRRQFDPIDPQRMDERRPLGTRNSPRTGGSDRPPRI